MILLAAALLAAPLATQGLATTGVEEIMAAMRSCIAATSPTKLDEDKLQADGWRRGSITSNGKSSNGDLTVYGKGGLLMILPRKQAQTPTCMFSAKLASEGDFLRAQAALAEAYGSDIGKDSVGEYIFVTPDHHMIDLARTGSPQTPALRIAVAAMPQEKK